MKKGLMLGLMLGFAIPRIKRIYDFRQWLKEHPEDPRAIESRESDEQLKAEWQKFKNTMKDGWIQAKTDNEFKDIIRDIDKN